MTEPWDLAGFLDRLADRGGPREGRGGGAENDRLEREADDQAKAWLFPQGVFESFLRDGCFSKPCIQDFAERRRRHPGIIVGRLQWEPSISYRAHRSLLEPVSPHLAVAWVNEDGRGLIRRNAPGDQV